MIRIDGTQKKRPTHREVIKYLIETYPVARDIAMDFLENLDEKIYQTLIDEYYDEIISKQKRELIKRYIHRKLEIMKSVLEDDN